jgi:serine/threonine protein kinase
MRRGTDSSRPTGVSEALRDAFEREWEQGLRPAIEDFLARAPETNRPRLLAELIRVEMTIRYRLGESPNVAEYQTRFPQYTGPLVAPSPETVSQAGSASPGVETPLLPSAWRAVQVHGAGDPLRKGRVLGEYELLEWLGAGGMGEVYRARHVRLGKEFALKVLLPRWAGREEVLARFVREVRAAGRVEHPNLVAAVYAGEADGTPYLVMELLRGEDLAARVCRSGPLPVREACEAVRQAALGLQAAHETGLVHRDVKPGNLFRTRTGLVKVLDLGLAALRDGGGPAGLTEADAYIGTPDYSAPEQILDSRSADARADVYALGCTLFHLLAGRPPFGDRHHTTLATKRQGHLSEPPPGLPSVRPEVPAALAALVARMLAKDPRDRPQTAAEVAAALAPFAGDTGSPPISTDRTARPPRGGRQRHWLVAAGLMAALVALCVSAWVWRSRHASVPPPDPSPPPTPGAVETRPLTARLRVFRYDSGGPNDRLDGQLGEDVFRVRFGDRVGVEAELSEPAHAYLIAFNPTADAGKAEQPVPRREADRTPEKHARLSPGVKLRLNDGVGLQAFAVVASRKPLPAYTAWRQQRPSLPWEPRRATAGVVWLSGGERTRGLYGPGGGVSRAVQEESDEAALGELARALRRLPGVEAVAVIGFAVEPAE